MSEWQVKFTDVAIVDFDKLDHKVKQRVTERLEWLKVNAIFINHKSLSGGFEDYFKLRVGDWRIAYKIDIDLSQIRVYYIDHRSKIYKRMRKSK